MSRRGRQEGLIHQRPDGRWEARVHVGWKNGRRVRKSIYGRTRSEVASSLRNAQGTLDRAEMLGDDSITLSVFLDQWLAEVVAPTRERSTWQGYEANVRRHIVPTLGHVRLTKLTPVMVQRLLNDLRRQGLAPRTIQYVHATLRAALNVAMRWELVQRNVASVVEPVSVKKREVVPFTPEEARQILAAAKGHRLASFYTVAMALGLRPSEALGLMWSDIDPDQSLLHVRRALERVPDGYRFKEPKSRTSRRAVYLPEVCVESLKDHRARQSADRLRAGACWQDLDLIFCSEVGVPLHRSAMSRQFTLLLERAGVAHRRLYDCRHTAASLLLAQGVSPRVVMETLGHSSFALTMDTYAHVYSTALRDAAAAMDRVLAAPAVPPPGAGSPG
jgi:integrase